MPSSRGNTVFGAPGASAASAVISASRSGGMSPCISGSRISPVRASSSRSSSSRMIRNELGTMPDAMPECCPDSSTFTVTVVDTSPRSDVVSHSRS